MGAAVNPAIKRKDRRQFYPAKSLHRGIMGYGKTAREIGGDE